MNKQKKADLLLLMITAFWGTSYYLTDISLTDLPPMFLNAFRFLSAFFVLGIVFRKKLMNMNRTTIRYSLLVGLVLTGTYIFYGYGISRTSLSNAAFISALPVVITPVFAYFIDGTLPGRKMLFCIAVCAVGLALLTLDDRLRPAVGDVICLGVPVCYALDLTMTERAVRHEEVDALALGVCQLGVVGIITFVLSILFEEPHLPTTAAAWFSSLFLGFFCTGISFVIQAVQQKYTTASHVGLIFTLEPVFATLVAFVFANEVLAPRGYLGMALMLLSLLFMELDLPVKRKQSMEYRENLS